MVTRTKPSTAFRKYSKAQIIHGLNDAIAVVERNKKTYEEQIAQWRVKSIEEFARKVQEYPERWWNTHDLEPPRMSKLCEDWRVQAINKALVRIKAMVDDDDSILLRGDDVVFEYIASAACE